MILHKLFKRVFRDIVMYIPSVYQSEEYKRALEAGGKNLIHISDQLFAIEREIKLPVLGVQKILEARGFPSREELKKFKEISMSYFYGTLAPTVMDPQHDLFKNEKYHKISNHTILVDLQKSEEDLWSSMEKKSARWGVKTAMKNDLRCVVPDANDFEAFYDLYAERVKAGGISPEAKESIHLLALTRVSKLLVVKHGRQVVAGGIILLDKNNKYAILDIATASDKGFELQAMPFLYWRLMINAKEQGLRYFDLGGYDVGAKKGDKLYNINKFKERFGGRVIEQPIYATHGRYVSMRKVLGAFRFMKQWYRKE